MCVFPAVQGKGWQSDPGRQGEVLEGSAPAPSTWPSSVPAGVPRGPWGSPLLTQRGL